MTSSDQSGTLPGALDTSKPACPGPSPEPLPTGPALPGAASHGEPVPASRADPGRPLGEVPAPVTVLDQLSFDPTVPNVARIYDALLGGKDNFAADREAARKLLDAVPGAARAARDNRRFLGRAVWYLAGEAGIRQFLDIGTGLPTQGNVHEIARAAYSPCRVVYVDYDPVVAVHAAALLADSPNVAAAQGDLRDPAHLLALPEVRALIDFGQPVAILMAAVLHFIEDCEDPWSIVDAYTRPGWPPAVTSSCPTSRATIPLPKPSARLPRFTATRPRRDWPAPARRSPVSSAAWT